MKRLLLLFTLIHIVSYTLTAGHGAGGEVYWECLPDGKFVFHANVYRNCQDSIFTYDSKILVIHGNPLPRTASNATINNLLLKPDSNKWIQRSFGDISPKCEDATFVYSCANNDFGAFQKFPYKSDPIELRGVPPATGWHFYLVLSCCRPLYANTTSGTTRAMYKASMYPTAANDDVTNCYDSSPHFSDIPEYVFCRTESYSIDYSAIDSNLDSLSYSWGVPLSSPASNPQLLQFGSSFSQFRQIPDSVGNGINKEVVLNNKTGQLQFGVSTGNNLIRNYITNIQVDAWRGGVKIASVQREIPFLFKDCPVLPNFKQNRRPKITIAGDSSFRKEIKVTAGQFLKLPVQVSDLDTVNGTIPFQKVTLVPKGYMFSRDFSDYNYCSDPGLSPCAILFGRAPVLNTQASPPQYEIAGYAGVATEFIWQTGCQHIKDKSAPPGSNSSIHNFILDVDDGYCPRPGYSSAFLSIRIKDPIPLQRPYMMGASVDLDGKVAYQWIPGRDTSNTFSRHYIESAFVGDRIPPGNQYVSLDTNLKQYGYEKITSAVPVYLPQTSDPSLSDILNPIPNRDYYFRMRTVSGCKSNEASIYSEPIRIMELKATAVGLNPGSARSRIKLEWNEPKDLKTAMNDNIVGRNAPAYHIWQADNVNTIADVDDASDWYKRGSTYSTNMEINSNQCGAIGAFRIERRDTIFIYKRSNELINLEQDTLVFSTFSLIDTIFMTLAKPEVQSMALDSLQTNYTADSFQWLSCTDNSALASGDRSSFIPTSAGEYKVAILQDGCRDTSLCFNVDTIDSRVKVVNNFTLKAESNQYRYQWLDCRMDTLLPGATDRELVLQDTGYYALIAYAYGFSDTSECIQMVSIGLDESDSYDDRILIYPNPSNGEVFIKRSGSRVFDLAIFNIHGQLVKEIRMLPEQNQFELPSSAGVYYVQLIDDSGKKANFKIFRH